MPISIRQASVDDAPALSRICLLTADAGKSAEDLHNFPELPGLLWAVPYVHLPTTWGFVMVDESNGEVVGYIVGSKDTRAYEEHAAENLWPVLAEMYPLSPTMKSGDKEYAEMLRKMRTISDSNLLFSPAHMHIDILEGYQKQGWGRKLIHTAAEYLKAEGIDGIWLIMNPRNLNARKFYERLGFSSIDGSPNNHVGLRFSQLAGHGLN